MVLGTVRILGSLGVVPGSDTSGDGLQYFVKNTEGGAKYQVGFQRSHTSCQKLCSCVKIN